MNEQELYQKAAEMRDEMNIRLFCDNAGGSETVLWVESIVLTEIVPPKKKERFWEKLGRLFRKLKKKCRKSKGE